MARSRRRATTRTGTSGSWINVATLSKIGATCLLGAAGTYGVFYTVSNMPGGADNITAGVEVGEFESTVAMTQKPPLPDDGVNSMRLASNGSTFPNALGSSPTDSSSASSSSAPNALLSSPQTPTQNKPIENVFAKNLNQENKPELPNTLRSPGSEPASPGGLSPVAQDRPNPLAGLPPAALPKPLESNSVSQPINGVAQDPMVDMLAKSSAPSLLDQQSTDQQSTEPNPASIAASPPPAVDLMSKLNATAKNNAEMVSDPLRSPPAPLGNHSNPLANASPSSNPLASNSNPSPPNNGLPGLPVRDPLSGIRTSNDSTTPAASTNPFLRNPPAANPPAANSGMPSNPANDINRSVASNLGNSNLGNRNVSPLGAAPLQNSPESSGISSGTIGIPRPNNQAQLNNQNFRGDTPSNPTPNPLLNSMRSTAASSLPVPNDTQVRPATYPDSGNLQAATRRESTLVSNQPGEAQWEIQQNAAVILEKHAPEQVQVNVPATFVLVVRNVGRVPASQVLIRDRIPEGARLIQATPKPDRQTGDLLEWDLATLPPGETLQITTELVPTQRGEIGSVAEVSLAAVAACRTRSTQPNLVIEHTAPPQVLVGQQVVMNITVRNDGDGPAENVIIRESVPAELQHQSGNEIENPIGRLLPGQSRNLQLPLLATRPGQVQNVVRVTGDGKLSDEHSIALQIVAPSLQVDMDGPTRRYLSREAVHQMMVKNNGTANATNVQMMAKLPRGLKYESSSPAGQYDPARHSVFWAIQQLPSGQSEQLSITTLPLAPGEQPIEFQALADLNQPQKVERVLLVEQLSELFFEVDDVDDPIEINSNTTYVVRLENQGSQVANDVSMVVDLPAGIEPQRVDGPVQYEVIKGDAGNHRIVFAPISVLNPGAKLATQIQVRGTREGDHKIEVQLTSAQRTAAVAKQESTKVYSDLR